MKFFISKKVRSAQRLTLASRIDYRLVRLIFILELFGRGRKPKYLHPASGWAILFAVWQCGHFLVMGQSR